MTLSVFFMVKAWEKDLEHDGPEWRVDIGEVEQTVLDFLSEAQCEGDRV
jgi:hypothetical protein